MWSSGLWGVPLWALGVIAAVLTAAYSFRVVLVAASDGPEKAPAPWDGFAVWVPLATLATLAVLSGFTVNALIGFAGGTAGASAAAGGAARRRGAARRSGAGLAVRARPAPAATSRGAAAPPQDLPGRQPVLPDLRAQFPAHHQAALRAHRWQQRRGADARAAAGARCGTAGVG
ncbi:MAG: hypothetical protein MZV49_02055 [Rhodopseudomonas palustris]|nr:hypothetical protein [Rhodopseudomonas palustris]